MPSEIQCARKTHQTNKHNREHFNEEIITLQDFLQHGGLNIALYEKENENERGIYKKRDLYPTVYLKNELQLISKLVYF